MSSRLSSALIGFILIACFAGPALAPPPPNANCANAPVITSTPFSEVLDTSQATLEQNEPPLSCLGYPHGASVWYKFTPATDGRILVDLSGTNYGTVVAFFTGTTCGSLTEGWCDAWSQQIPLGVSANVPIYVLVGGAYGYGGELHLSVSFATGLPNDNCAGATDVVLDENNEFSQVLDTTDATFELDEPALSCLSPALHGASVWYAFTANQAGQLQVNTFGSGYDTVLAIFSGTCTSLTELACNDDSGGLQSQAALGMAAYQLVLILAGAYGSYFGGDLHFNLRFAPRPPNDDCADATLIEAAPFHDSLDVLAATPEAVGEPPISCVPAERSVFYTYTPPRSGSLTVETCGSDFRTVIVVFRGTCGSIEEAACNAAGLCYPGTRITRLAVQGGVPLLIEVADVYPDAEHGHLEFDLTFEALENDDCANAALVDTLPFHVSVNTGAATRDAVEPSLSCDYGNRTHTVWYTLTPSVGGKLDISTAGSNYSTVIGVFTGSCGSLQEIACTTNSSLSCISVAKDEAVFIEVADENSPGSGGDLVLDVSFAPDFVMFWETSPAMLANKLITALPPGIRNLTAEVVLPQEDGQPAPTLWSNEGIGFYESFNLTDGVNSLSMPDGIVLTTGLLRRTADVGAQGLTCANVQTNFTWMTQERPGDRQEYLGVPPVPGIRELYADTEQLDPPNVHDGIEFRLTFESEATVPWLRLKVILASDEFPEWAPPEATPAELSKQQGFGCYPDTFAAFLDGQNFATVPITDPDNPTGPKIPGLMSVAPEVITLNNNISGSQDHNVYKVEECPGSLDPDMFTNVNYEVEYDGFAAKQVSAGNWTAITLTTPLTPSEPGYPHQLRLAITDVGPAPSGDGILDTAAFISSLEFISCHCPPSDADGDGDVDLADFNNGFQACFNGPNRPYKLDADVCFCMDADHDGDIDLADFNVFQNCFNGPNRPPKCDTLWCQGSASGQMTPSAELSDVVFDLYSPSSGKAIAAGTPVEWSVSVRTAGLDAAVAGCAFDLELRQDSDDGALTKLALPPPTFATPFSDGSAVWSVSGPSNRPLGTLGGLGDAFPVPWSADSAARLAALSAETAATFMAGRLVSAGSIDTTGLTPGRYVLVLRPVNANVLRSEENLTGALIGNFAAAARAVAGTRTVAFDVAK